jgi:hypothetical protein
MPDMFAPVPHGRLFYSVDPSDEWTDRWTVFLTTWQLPLLLAMCDNSPLHQNSSVAPLSGGTRSIPLTNPSIALNNSLCPFRCFPRRVVCCLMEIGGNTEKKLKIIDVLPQQER